MCIHGRACTHNVVLDVEKVTLRREGRVLQDSLDLAKGEGGARGERVRRGFDAAVLAVAVCEALVERGVAALVLVHALLVNALERVAGVGRVPNLTEAERALVASILLPALPCSHGVIHHDCGNVADGLVFIAGHDVHRRRAPPDLKPPRVLLRHGRRATLAHGARSQEADEGKEDGESEHHK
jgi:hypothetical protein